MRSELLHRVSGWGWRFVASVAAGLVVTSCATAPRAPIDVVCIPAYQTGVRQDITHIVGPAETVWRISKMYDVPIDAILSANRITDPTTIIVGQKMRVPDAATVRPVIPLFPSKKWKYIVIHHSVTDTGDAMSLDKIHRRRGFNRGLGYHFVIDSDTGARTDGQIEASPRWIKQMDGAHCSAGGMNRRGIGICLVGDFTCQGPSEKQMEALVLLVNTLRRYYHIPLSRVIRHKDAPGAATECPGKSFPWAEFKRRLKTGR